MVNEWQALEQLSVDLPSNLAYWLTQAKRLGKELSVYFHDIKIKKIVHLHTSIEEPEQKLLNTSKKEAFVRLISHHQNHRNIVLGRAIIPYPTYRRYQFIFDSLNNSSIGENFLFQKDNMTRSGFYLRQYSTKEVSTIFQDAIVSLSFVWARASIFCIDIKYQMLIEEFFLEFPEIGKEE
jgi:chorismate-pyruvate lyase